MLKDGICFHLFDIVVISSNKDCSHVVYKRNLGVHIATARGKRSSKEASFHPLVSWSEEPLGEEILLKISE